jgi:hypothetical protein
MKILVLAVLALSLGVAVYVWKTEIGDDEIFILPDGYTGVVLILHGQKHGEPKKYENGKRVYEIPSNGILKTQFSLNTGWHTPGKYFYKDNGKLTELPYLFDDRDVEARRVIASKIHICCPSNGVAGKDPTGPSVVYEQFYVGTDEQILEASEKREKINPADLIN